MTFKSALLNTQKLTTTTNGMVAYTTTGSAVVDLFSKVGSSRGQDISDLFSKALAEDADLALRVMLWARDVRQGAGERETFRSMLKEFTLKNWNRNLSPLFDKIYEIGRVDDILYVHPAALTQAYVYYANLIRKGDCWAAKWAPRITSFKEAKTEKAREKLRHAYNLAKVLGYTPKQYRKAIVAGSSTVEQYMSANRWNSIDFSAVPSVASARYQNAFKKHVPEKYSAFLDNVSKGLNTMNASSVFPHDIVKSVYNGDSKAASLQWANLPNYMNDTKILPMVDVSGSMLSAKYSKVQPILVAMALGIYVAEKASSEFSNIVMTFSGRPDFFHLTGDLPNKVRSLRGADWGTNTNLEAAFDRLLQFAVEHRIKASNMPEILLILSDMQFDKASNINRSAMQMIQSKYARAGYEMPKIVFWNLNAHPNTPVLSENSLGVAEISGFSPAIMKAVLSNSLDKFTPKNVMMEAIMNDRYKITWRA